MAAHAYVLEDLAVQYRSEYPNGIRILLIFGEFYQNHLELELGTCKSICTVKELRQNQFILIILYTCSEIALKVKQNGAYHNYKNIVQF